MSELMQSIEQAIDERDYEKVTDLLLNKLDTPDETLGDALGYVLDDPENKLLSSILEPVFVEIVRRDLPFPYAFYLTHYCDCADGVIETTENINMRKFAFNKSVDNKDKIFHGSELLVYLFGMEHYDEAWQVADELRKVESANGYLAQAMIKKYGLGRDVDCFGAFELEMKAAPLDHTQSIQMSLTEFSYLYDISGNYETYDAKFKINTDEFMCYLASAPEETDFTKYIDYIRSENGFSI